MMKNILLKTTIVYFRCKSIMYSNNRNFIKRMSNNRSTVRQTCQSNIHLLRFKGMLLPILEKKKIYYFNLWVHFYNHSTIIQLIRDLFTLMNVIYKLYLPPFVPEDMLQSIVKIYNRLYHYQLEWSPFIC